MEDKNDVKYHLKEECSDAVENMVDLTKQTNCFQIKSLHICAVTFSYFELAYIFEIITVKKVGRFVSPESRVMVPSIVLRVLHGSLQNKSSICIRLHITVCPISSRDFFTMNQESAESDD